MKDEEKDNENSRWEYCNNAFAFGDATVEELDNFVRGSDQIKKDNGGENESIDDERDSTDRKADDSWNVAALLLNNEIDSLGSFIINRLCNAFEKDLNFVNEAKVPDGETVEDFLNRKFPEDAERLLYYRWQDDDHPEIAPTILGKGLLFDPACLGFGWSLPSIFDLYRDEDSLPSMETYNATFGKNIQKEGELDYDAFAWFACQNAFTPLVGFTKDRQKVLSLAQEKKAGAIFVLDVAAEKIHVNKIDATSIIQNMGYITCFQKGIPLGKKAEVDDMYGGRYEVDLTNYSSLIDVIVPKFAMFDIPGQVDEQGDPIQFAFFYDYVAYAGRMFQAFPSGVSLTKIKI